MGDGCRSAVAPFLRYSVMTPFPRQQLTLCRSMSLSFGTPFAPSNLVRRIGAVRRDVVLRFGNIQRIMPAWN